jgi:3-methyladenine DNA glycosylase AlkC
MTKAELAEIKARKGAVRISEIPLIVRELLDAGTIESVNLVEWLAVDQAALVQKVLPQLGLRAAVSPALAQLGKLPQPSQMKAISCVAVVLLAHTKPSEKAEVFQNLAAHPSDTVRSWATYVVGLDDELPLAHKLERLRPLATDANAGVREIAWMAVRQDIERELHSAIDLLSAWTAETNANLRRFASEATRPRGVWCKHLNALKEDPALGLPILEPLRNDASKYVRDSVGNWLNDASKSRPAWVQTVCEHWVADSPTKETSYIVKKALRTINKTAGNLR